MCSRSSIQHRSDSIGKTAPQKNFVMCTVSMMFKDYAAFKDVPCDYIVFDNLLIYNDKVIPTQDYEAWAAFQSFIKSQPTPKPGISFMGAYLADMSGLVGKQPVQKALKDLFQAGVRACGVTGVDIPTVQADQAKVTSSLKTFFTALDSISEENVHYFGAFRIPKAAKFEGLAAFLGNVHIGVVITHNKLWQKIVDYDNCKIRASSSWNVEGDATFENAAYALSKVTSPDKPLGVSFSMAAYSHVISSDTTVSDTSSAFGQKCQYRSPISYQNWCRATGGTDGTTQNMAVRKFNVTSRSVVSFDTKNSMEAKIKQLKTTVKYPIGVLLADIPFDMIDGTSCGSDVSLGRVKGIADVIHS
ncbi:uncharacterized protein LOC135397087 isoform X2 [Ornithodoros turicata]|uniref:uncharacterized protein LOC135397087 isoform X2 n=1 Tax=Ornithodoros turicata TaxID=34597 RepID=UPI00313963F6